MKRKVIFGALAALFLGGGIVTAVNLTQKEQVSDLTLANIEAMTGGENGILSGCENHCIADSGRSCYYNYADGTSGVCSGMRNK